MRKLIILLVLCWVVILLAGCQTYRTVAAEKGAEASDAALESALWYICNGASVGSIKRALESEEKADAYNVICPENQLP